ncbi:MAG TPA: HAMP domain-containing sensor histidine kinase [Beijerinckiaceae bacterium]|nr:HAMP domain-containing sensor histidine kinase [Beijerinckiaceae bacterium]
MKFGKGYSQFHEGTMRSYQRLVADAVETWRSTGVRPIPASIQSAILDDRGVFAVVDDQGVILASSPGISKPLSVTSNQARDYFTTKIDGQLEYGLSVPVLESEPPLWVQVAFPDGDVVYDTLLEEFLQDVAWVWLPFVILLILVNTIIVSIALRPLRVASHTAESIGPSSVSVRLPEAGMPNEVLVFVHAVNGALDRLQQGIQLQEEFISDAAHELRTPLSVIRAQVSSSETLKSDTLRRDVLDMSRLVDQLLDRARLGGLHFEAEDLVDLGVVARDVGERIAPIALAGGRTIEVVDADRSVTVNGSYDYLFRAARNLVENAVAHTPIGTAVIIAVDDRPAIHVIDRGPGIPADQRQNITKRFWQGKRDRSQGAGLGLSIVQQTIAAHGGALEIADNPSGGAIFSMIFPKVWGASSQRQRR